MFIIAKLNKDKKFCGFLYKTYNGRYLFDTNSSNVHFDTEEAALNFVYYCSDYVKIIYRKEILFLYCLLMMIN